MPRNYLTTAKHVVDRDKEKEMERIQRRLELESQRPKRPRRNSKMYELCKMIYDTFTELMDNPSRTQKSLPASEFDGIKSFGYSPVTLSKAKKLLGIRSYKVGVHWRWSIPRFSYDAALEKMHEQRLRAIQREAGSLDAAQPGLRPSAGTLADCMSRVNYLAPANDVRELMMREGYARTTVHAKKSELGIGSLKGSDGIWYWVWGPYPVQAWLEEKLSAGPVGQIELYNLAYKEHGWAPEVIQAAKQSMGFVGRHWIYDRKTMTKYMGWFDVNHPPEEEDGDFDTDDFRYVDHVIHDPGWHRRNKEKE